MPSLARHVAPFVAAGALIFMLPTSAYARPAMSPTASASGGQTLAPMQFRPVSDWCPTNRTCFAHITWTSYSATRAVGHGRGKSCAGGGGGCSTKRTTVRLWRARHVCGSERFTRLRMFGRSFRLMSAGCSFFVYV